MTQTIEQLPLNTLSSPTYGLNNILLEEYRRLSKLCLELDPYQPLTEAQKDELAYFDIRCWDNPFALTNEMLQKLMELEEQLPVEIVNQIKSEQDR